MASLVVVWEEEAVLMEDALTVPVVRPLVLEEEIPLDDVMEEDAIEECV